MGCEQMINIKELLGIKIPIIQAPMAGVQNSELTIAVSNAGGLGSLPCALLGLDALRAELTAIAMQTERSYNVNFFCHTPPECDKQQQIWRAALAPYYREYAIDIESVADEPWRVPFSAEMAELLSEFKPPVVSFHFGLPSAELLARVKTWGAKILSTATTVAEARWLEAHGADAIIAQGLEAGGHRGMFLDGDLANQIGTFALLPKIVHAVKVPVIAAGGIADARGVTAALAVGAAGVQIGTAFLLCPEATTSAVHRTALKPGGVALTALTNVFTGRPARGIVNRLMRELGPISTIAPQFPLAGAAIAPLRNKAESENSGDFSPLWCGQNASGCKDIPAAALLRELVPDPG